MEVAACRHAYVPEWLSLCCLSYCRWGCIRSSRRLHEYCVWLGLHNNNDWTTRSLNGDKYRHRSRRYRKQKTQLVGAMKNVRENLRVFEKTWYLPERNFRMWNPRTDCTKNLRRLLLRGRCQQQSKISRDSLASSWHLFASRTYDFPE